MEKRSFGYEEEKIRNSVSEISPPVLRSRPPAADLQQWDLAYPTARSRAMTAKRSDSATSATDQHEAGLVHLGGRRVGAAS
jgi:hypothetical protein